jgi:hypothetical protein
MSSWLQMLVVVLLGLIVIASVLVIPVLRDFSRSRAEKTEKTAG